MTTIKFITNLVSRSSPWQFSPSYFDRVPNKPGVYIVGVKIDIDNQREKFCPLYVGETKNIQNRIWEHYEEHLNGRKAVFDLSSPIKEIYKDINYWSKNKPKTKKSIFPSKAQLPNTLIWHNDVRFFNTFFNFDGSKYINHLGHFYSLQFDLPQIMKNYPLLNNDSSNLIGRIQSSLNIYKNNFFFFYFEKPYSHSFTLQQIEAATKFQLQKDHKIYTISAVNNKNGGTNMWSDLVNGKIVGPKFDFSEMAKEIIIL
jgi:hypothetical protein